MAFAKYQVSVPAAAIYTLETIVVDGNNHAINEPLDTSNPALASHIESILNALGLGAALFTVTLTSDGAGGFLLNIFTACTNAVANKVVVSGGEVSPEDFPFTLDESCETATIVTEVEVDCPASCITFRDVTKAYNLNANPEGYGYPPNYPSIADILSTEFWITVGSDTYIYADSGYLPNALGTTEICLAAENFFAGSDQMPAFVGGETYQLVYVLNMGNGETRETDPIDFVFPCCGSSVLSNLATDFDCESVNCGLALFTDTTGSYDADNNPGGYGSPNYAYSDITETEIIITKGDGSIVTITDWVPTAEDQTRDITATDLGYTDNNIPDQLFTVEYNVYKEGKCRIGHSVKYQLWSCNFLACLTARACAALDTVCTPCGTSEKTELDEVLDMSLIYGLLILAVRQEKYDCANGIIEKLYKRCSNKCGPC